MPIDWAALAAALANAGGWAVVIVIGIGLSVGFVRGWLVPGFAYRREVERADGSTAALKSMTDALHELTDEVRWDTRDRLTAERLGRSRHEAS